MNEASNWIKQHVSFEWVWIGVAVISGIGIVWNTLSIFSSVPHSTETFVPLPPAKSISPANLNAPLFGEYVPDLKHAEVADSHLTYVIVGIMYSTDPHQSQALIQAEDGFSKTYRQGDFLSPHLEIKEIQADGIIILNEGRFERLSLPKNDLRFDPLPPPLKMKE
jgi:type II secretory pathway component PulC